MALSTRTRNGWVYMGNLDPNNSAYEEALAPVSGYQEFGIHHVGIHGLYQNPILTRTYCDLSAINLDAYSYVGYVRFIEIDIKGQPIPPSVFGGAYLNHAPYEAPSGNCHFVDFMGLGDAIARRPTTGGILPPMYAFNSMLWTSADSVEKLSKIGQYTTNGRLYRPNDMQDENCTPYVSLCGQVNTSLITKEIIEFYIKRSTILVDLDVDMKEIAEKPLYETAINYLKAYLPEESEDRNINIKDITYGRFVDEYLLLNVCNDEDMEPLLCVHLNSLNSHTTLTIYLIDYDAANEMERQGVLDLLNRVREYGIFISVENTKTEVKGRGNGIGFAVPVANGKPLVTFHIKDCVCGVPNGMRRRSQSLLRFISGVHYQLPFLFDDDSGGLVLGEPGQFAAIDGPDRLLHHALQQYEVAYLDGSAHVKVDTSNFDMIGASWITPATSAHMLTRRKQPVA